MTFFRRRLRLWAAVWFLFQGASLTAIVPRDCCATHGQTSHEREHVQHQSLQQESAAQQASCHKVAATPPPDEAQCTMRGADGRPCPMHRKGHAAHAAHTGAGTGTPPSPDTDSGAPVCSLRAICNGPMAGLAVLLVQPGVLPNRTALPVDLRVDDAPPESPVRLIHGLFSPDLPPPRA